MEEKIIEMYKEGYSQKEICSELNILYILTNKVLTSYGFDTKSYRKLPDEIRQNVCFMIKEGYKQQYISDILDISIHMVRDISYTNNLQGVSENKRYLDDKEKIIDLYTDGKNITEISRILHADRNRIKNILISSGVYNFPIIKDNLILDDYKNGLTLASIIKKHNTGYRRVKRIIAKFERSNNNE